MSTRFIGISMWCFTLILLVRGLPTSSEDETGVARNEAMIRDNKSAEIHKYLNESYDPCEDLYEFACGNFNQYNQAPTGSTFKTGFFETHAKSLSSKFETLLNAEDDKDTTATDAKVKDFYKSCLAVESLNNVYQLKLQEIIAEFGQMPALVGDQWRDSEFDWLQTVAEIGHKYNYHLIVGYFMAVDRTNNTINRMHILAPQMPLKSKSAYTEAAQAQLRDGYISSMAINLNRFLGLEAGFAEQTAREMFEFEKHLYVGYDENVAIPGAPEDPRLPYALPPKLVTIDEMQSKYFPQLDIKRLISISLGSVPTAQMYDLLGNQVENIAIVMRETPKHIVANYIFYHLLSNFMFAPPPDVKQELCLKMTKSHFAKVLNNMVYRKYTTNEEEQDVNYMWHTIKNTFQQVLESDKLTWMNADTRKYAVEKLKTIRLEINSYQQLNFTYEYGLLRVNKGDYIENLKSLLALSAIKSRIELNQPPKPYDDPAVLAFTPFFIQPENLIKVPVGILQSYYSYPNALKFGTLGFIIAHELIHGYDELGRNFDKTGNQREWWDKDSNEYFNRQTQCLGAQYHEYIYEGRYFPELMSQAENTADNGGIRLAYSAYLRWYEDASRSYEDIDLESFVQLKYSSKQLFFISYAQLWCSVTNPLLRAFVVATDAHVPDNLRILGPLSNLEEFSQEFNCPYGSAMNPIKKCIIY